MMRTKDMKGLMEAISSVMTPQVTIDEARQMKDPKKDSMITKGGKTIVIDKSKEKEYLAKGWTLSEKKKLDPVDDKANDKEFKDRKDKDIDNDGDVDSSDEFLHKKRAATDDAIDGGDKPAKNAKPKKGVNPFKKEDVDLEEGKVKSKMIDDSEKMSKKDFIKKYGKQNADDLYEAQDEEEDDKKKKPNPFAKKDDGEEKDSEDESEDEVKDPKVAGKKDDKKKVASNAKTAEISKIGEDLDLTDAVTELHNMWESAARKSNATKPEEMDSKDSPKAKEFAKKSGKGSEEVNNDIEDAKVKSKSAEDATKASSGKRNVDNTLGDNKIVKSTVAEDADNVIAQAQNIIDGKTMSEIAAMEEPKSKNPHDARTREARSFLQRMAKRA
tara:strand:- start:24 stop:1178 length:1155 start_codon:yes stop_codon:yes gene_type:complete